MAVVQTGSTLEFITGGGNTANTFTISSTITVPSDAEFMTVALSAYTGTEFCVDGALLFTKGGVQVAMTAATAGSADDTSKWGAGSWYLLAPDTGTNKSLTVDFPGTGSSTDGTMRCAVRFYKGVDTSSPVRSTAGVGGTSFPMNTGTLTAQAGDLIDIALGGFVGAQDGSGAVTSWNNATGTTECTNNGFAEISLATASPSGNTTVGAQTVTGYSEAGILAIVIKPTAITLGGYFLQEDGTSHFLLENGSGSLVHEETVGGTGYSTSVTAGTVAITGASITDVFARTEAVTDGTVAITGASVTPVLGFVDTVTSSNVAITGATVTPAIARTEAVTAGTVAITGAAVSPVFGIIEAVTTGTVAITGASVTPVFGRVDAVTAGTVAITGATVAPVLAITEAVTPSSVSITGATIAPLIGFTDTVTSSSVPITGATIAPVLAITEAVTPDTVAITGASVTPSYSAGGTNYSISVTAGTVSITGATVAPVFAITEAVTAGTVAITGATVVPVFGRVDTVTPSTVSITGATITPVFGRVDTVTPASVPITGATVLPSIGLTEAVTAGTVAITGATVTPIFSAGGNSYSVSVTAGTVSITGATIAPLAAFKETVTPSTVSITGATVVPVRGRTDTVTPASVPITGATITPSVATKETVTPASVPVTGATVSPAYGRSIAVTPSNVPITGSVGGSGTIASALGSNLLLWHDGADSSSVTGTSPVTSWGDDTGLGNSATGATGREPSYNSTIKSIANGIMILDHDNVGAEWNVFIVSRRLGDTSDYRTLLQWGSNDHLILCTVGTNNLGAWNGGFFGTGQTWAQNELHLVRGQRLSTGTSISLDGNALAASGTTNSTDPNYLGGAITGGQNWGDVHEVIFLPGNASTTNVQLVEGYLAWKWDAILGGSTLVTALPSGHPYKTAAPAFAGPAFGRVATVTPGSVPITESVIAPFLSRAFLESVTPSNVPIIGAAVTPALTSGPITYLPSVTTGDVPIIGGAVTPVLYAAPVVFGGPAVTLRGSALYASALEGSAQVAVGGLQGSAGVTSGLEGSPQSATGLRSDTDAITELEGSYG